MAMETVMAKGKIGISLAILGGSLIAGLCLAGSSNVLAGVAPIRNRACPTKVSPRLLRTVRLDGNTLRLKPGTMMQVGRAYSSSFACRVNK